MRHLSVLVGMNLKELSYLDLSSPSCSMTKGNPELRGRDWGLSMSLDQQRWGVTQHSLMSLKVLDTEREIHSTLRFQLHRWVPVHSDPFRIVLFHKQRSGGKFCTRTSPDNGLGNGTRTPNGQCVLHFTSWKLGTQLANSTLQCSHEENWGLCCRTSVGNMQSPLA